MFRRSNLFLLAAVLILGSLTLGRAIGSAVSHQIKATEHRLGIDRILN